MEAEFICHVFGKPVTSSVAFLNRKMPVSLEIASSCTSLSKVSAMGRSTWDDKRKLLLTNLIISDG